MKTFYEQLGITPQASQTVIQQSFFRLAKKLAPKSPLNYANERAHAEYQAVQCAFRTLSNPESRCDYDRRLQMQSLKPSPRILLPAMGKLKSR